MKHLILLIWLFTAGTIGLMAQPKQSPDASKKLLVSWQFPEIDSGNTEMERFVINLNEHPVYQYAVKINHFPYFFTILKSECADRKADSPCILLCLDTACVKGERFIDVAEMSAKANPDRYAQYVSGERTPMDTFTSKKSIEVYDWIHQELEKGRIVSLVYEDPMKKKTLVTARSFSND